MPTIRHGDASDAPALLALFDEAVAWLVARGQTGQWGTEPFSSRPRTAAAVRGWAAGGGLWLAEEDGAALGGIVLGDRPAHVAPAAEPELYIGALVTSRAHAGRGIGADLVRHAIAETRAAGIGLLRVDCWAGAPPLVAWYEAQGFTPDGTFTLDGWTGQVFSMRV